MKITSQPSQTRVFRGGSVDDNRITATCLRTEPCAKIEVARSSHLIAEFVCGGRGSARDNRLQSDPSDAVCMMYPAEASVGFSNCLPLLQVHDVRKRSWCLVAVSTEAFGHGSTRFPQKFPHARWALRANMNKQLEHTMFLPCDVGIRCEIYISQSREAFNVKRRARRRHRRSASRHQTTSVSKTLSACLTVGLD